jgi:hypothetical protein
MQIAAKIPRRADYRLASRYMGRARLRAARRMVELNMATPPLGLPPGRSSIDELEALYALPSRDQDDRLE